MAAFRIVLGIGTYELLPLTRQTALLFPTDVGEKSQSRERPTPDIST